MNTDSCILGNVANRKGIRKPQRNPSPLGANVRRRRTELNLSTAELAEAAGISTAHLHMIEHGERVEIRGKTLRGLADGLSCTIEELMEGTEVAPGTAVPAGKRELEKFIRERHLQRAEAEALREAAQKLGPRPDPVIFMRLLDLVREEIRLRGPKP